MTRYILLNPDDIHRPGDEVLAQLYPQQWEPVHDRNIDFPVDDSAPCRRPIQPSDLAQARASIKPETKTL